MLKFNPVSKEDTKDAMEQMVLAYMDARDDSDINSLLLIPCVILVFLFRYHF